MVSPWYRLLSILQSELDADDARLELGGRDPSDDTVWCQLPDGWRVVVVFDRTLEDHRECQHRLESLIASFSNLIRSGLEEAPPAAAPIHRELDRCLRALADRIHGLRAVVVDDRSPVIWGNSEPHGHEETIDYALRTAAAWRAATEANLDLDRLCQQADRPDTNGGYSQNAAAIEDAVAEIRRIGHPSPDGTRRHHLLVMRAIAEVRSAIQPGTPPLRHERVDRPDYSYVIRSFATIYRLIVVFPGPAPELQVEGPILRALPAIERLVLALPPIDPDPGGRVVRLRPLREI